MINITGFLLPYKNSRKLTEKEKDWRFLQGKPRKGITSVSDFDTTIKMNSTYIEMVDKHYLERGVISLITLPAFIVMLYLFFNSIFFL
ncbi:hypothetical protein [Xenorhabdus entomophaga]|uniref:hypothetical protein n=1 Tax=Xenorhabdus entomophaga TaxID=3136257 RepID=UPI0030F39505